eukprot:snap_masked-scaffold_140-processed-gene-0.1-mRNA-1 protein AED:1.00 eAED:1.00 QI:0/-1/0/0/-1/1/1/0/69
MSKSTEQTGIETVKDLKDVKLNLVQSKSARLKIILSLILVLLSTFSSKENENQYNHEVKMLGKIKRYKK